MTHVLFVIKHALVSFPILYQGYFAIELFTE